MVNSSSATKTATSTRLGPAARVNLDASGPPGRMRPLIGLTSQPKRVRSVFGDTPHQTVPDLYLDLIKSAGGTPVILPVHQHPDRRLFGSLDGVVLTGGGDVDPRHYGQDHEQARGVDGERDHFEMELVRFAADTDLPLLAICRGTQVLNVTLGGSLIGDLATYRPNGLDHRDVAHWSGTSHHVAVGRDSALAQLVGEEMGVNSLHHQSIAEPSRHLKPVAWAPDGIIEAVESPTHRFMVGVQWHPECLGCQHPGFALIERFIGVSAGGRP
jgi:putative glutamine amidotransferase